MQTPTVTLKNGAVEAEPVVVTAMVTLRHLFSTNPIAAYELVMKCRDSQHEFWVGTEQELRKLSLVQPDGNIHDSVRNIVLSAFEGEGLDMTLTSPVK